MWLFLDEIFLALPEDETGDVLGTSGSWTVRRMWKGMELREITRQEPRQHAIHLHTFHPGAFMQGSEKPSYPQV